MSSAGWANAATLPPNWQILPVSPDVVEDGLPTALRSPQLGKEGKRLPQVQMVVDLPFAQVLPLVQTALKPVGTFSGELGSNQVARIDQGWGDVLLARRPELVRDYLRQYELPTLQQYVSEGALLDTEIPGRLARLERQFRFEGRGERMPALQGAFSYWTGSSEQRYGALGRSKSTVHVRVTQLDAVMGRPATAVTLWRTDDWPNPGGGIVGQVRALADANIFSSGPQTRIQRNSVPQPVFNPVFEALSAQPGARLRIGAGALDWIAPPKPVAAIIEPQRKAPDADAATIPAQRMLRIERVMALQTFEADDMQILADGSALLVQNHPFKLMRWSPADGDTPRTLWTAPQPSVSRWMLSADARGQVAHLLVDGQVMRYELAHPALVTHPLAFDQKGVLGDSYVRYFHDGNGVPLAYRRDYAGKRDTLQVWAPVASAADEGARWDYRLQFAAPRQHVMRGDFPGNAQVKPVQWDGPTANRWIEDVFGLSELDAATGRVLRVLPLPRRFGNVDAFDDIGMAQWTPPPFGSINGRWIAVGFVLMDGERRNPGMHVVDMDSGKLRYSLTMPGRDSLTVAAGSLDGRLLALGSAGGDKAAVLWNLDTGRSLTLQANRETCEELRQLQWSADGRRLWGRCVNALVQWELPAAWQSRQE
ncbi:hypothetical protein [Stenotrophomonas sp. SY1]|uniref:WD40 repeat domain-containing protein n=1 Tax=Stenotrophomonas sp. SY1 TaxID=477235 RepID=UPI001E43D275|nr:hypothetical protein [Stenotrophomonas sp. SY1]MCD9085736.1 hypothetical protein [Stenotrophomonas sp. SY1]